ncbi:MAG: hypothetical protein VKI42_01940 [Synechococcaceae cyanobacterium]|nr:hypothetical protein [Synechococcaceae cyanobacterium]
MAGAAYDTTWRLPKFCFTVTGLNNSAAPVPLQEVSGLNTENTPIEYRHGDGNGFTSCAKVTV